jgi:hypothetical protein
MSVSSCPSSILYGVAAIALAVSSAAAQVPRPGAKVAPPKPYRAIPVTLPKPSADPGFAAFRKEVLDIAGRKDRAALARVVASTFFWLVEKGDKANRKKSGIDNLAEAAELDAADGSGWEALIQVVGDPTLESFPGRKGVMCSPADPGLDQRAAERLFRATGTQPFEWAYTTRPGVEARAAPQADAPVVETLAGIQLIRIMSHDAPSAPTTFVRVVTPGGKLGYAPADSVNGWQSQICYVKDARGWKIAGLVGG